MPSANSYCYFHILFMYHALYFPMFIFTLYAPCFPFFLINHNQKQVLLIKWVIFFLKLEDIILLFSTFWKWSYSQRCFNFNVMKLDLENNSIVLTLSNFVNINIELTLFNVVNFNVDIHNVVSTLIRHCPTSRRHITLTTTLRPRWKVSWGLTNVAKRLHNFVKLSNWKHIYLAEYVLFAAFLSFGSVNRTTSV